LCCRIGSTVLSLFGFYIKKQHKACLALFIGFLTMNIDKRIIGEQNTRAILTALHRFGWLTSRMISVLVWPEAKQAPAMARRAVRTLADQKLLLKRQLPEGGDCYTLSAAGARWLLDKEGIAAKAGSTLKLGNPMHRACSNWYLINRMLAGDTIWTEYEIQTGRAPVCNIGGKVPDGLCLTDFGLVWVEVENAWKNRIDRSAIVRFCQRNLATGPEMIELAPDFYLFRVAVVSTNSDALRAMHRSFVDARALGDLSERQVDNIELALLPVDRSLVAGNYEQVLLCDVIT
jgi:hypothetical protein